MPASQIRFAAIATLMALSVPANAADKLLYMNDWLPGGDKAIPCPERFTRR